MKELVKAISNEIVYQGFTASRASGLRPVSVNRAILNARWGRWIGAVLPTLLIVFYLFLFFYPIPKAASVKPSELATAISIFAWSGFSITVSSSLSLYALQGTGYIRDFLYTLPLEPPEVEGVLLRSITSLFDLQAYLMLAVALASLVLLRAFFAFFSIVFGVEIAIIMFEALVKAMSGARRTLLGSISARLIVTFLPLAFVAIFLLAQPFSFISAQGPASLFLPILDFANGSYFGMASSAAWIVLAGYVALRELKGTALRFFEVSPQTILLRPSVKGWKITGPTLGVLKADVKQAFRSSMAGIFVVPLLLAGVILGEFGGASATAIRAVGITYGIELALLSSMPAYSLYVVETRGALAFRVLPLSRLRLALPKVLLALLSYYIYEGVLVLALLVKGAGVIYVLPLLLGSVGVAASVLLLGVVFEQTMRSGGSASFPVAVLSFIAQLLVVTLPLAFYYAAVLIGLGVSVALGFELATSAVELLIAYYLLFSYDKG